MKLGPVEITDASDDIPARAAILIWGQAGCGKTTFAATAPGKKLWLSFGDQEHVSVMHRKDVSVAKLYDLSLDDLFKHVQNDNPLGLDQFLIDNEDIQTVVCDSVTAIAFRALQKAIKMGIGAGRGFTPTIEAPGISAYGARNGITLEILTGLLRVTAKHGVHLIMTAHENDPIMTKVNGQDVIDYIGIMLGGQLVNNTSWRLSEIWHMSQDTTGKKNHRIAIRPTRLRKPMKTRMFRADGPPDFELIYNPDKPDKGQQTIATWIDAWIASKGKKQELPK